MLPDIPVLALKLRDYFFWLLPAGMLALAITGGLIALIAFYDPAGYIQVMAPMADRATPSTPGRWLLWRLLGRPSLRPVRARLVGQLWILTLSTAVTPLALVLTAALHPVLAVLRLGFALLLAAVLSGAMAVAGPIPVPQEYTPAPRTSPPSIVNTDKPMLTLLRLWWRHTWGLFDQVSTPLLASALIGGLFTAWRPATQAITVLAQYGSVTAIPMALLTILLPFPAGTDVPLARAMETFDAPFAAVVALLLGSPLLNWPHLRQINAQYGQRALIIYTLVGLSVVILLAAVAALMFGSSMLGGF